MAAPTSKAPARGSAPAKGSQARRPSPRKPVKQTNWFAIWVSIAVVVVLVAVGAIVVWMNNASSTPAGGGSTEKPTASNIDTATGAIIFGSGSKTMDTYIDFMCPVCQQFESVFGSEIQTLVGANTITLNLHPISILDRSDSAGTEYSSRAASAMYSVAIADPDHAYAFMEAMYTNKPQENTPGLTDAQIITIAKNAGVTMSSDLEKSIDSNKYVNYVQTMTEKTPIAPGSTGIGTPTVVIDGKAINNNTLPSDPSQLINLWG
jgi:protein-disulfide isomerase